MQYEDIGFKCGLEIHRRVKGRKLFCYCSGESRDEKEVCRIERKLRVRESELGEMDVAALEQTKKDKVYRYKVTREGSCLIDMD